jgi:hypothetical protein
VVTASPALIRWAAANSAISGIETDMKIGGWGSWTGRGQIEIVRYS